MSQTINIIVDYHTLIKILLLGFAGFAFSMLLTPLYTTFAYKKEWWKKPRTLDATGKKATVFQKLHAGKHRRNIPTAAGVIFVIATLIVTLTSNLARTETWLPIAAMTGAGLIGFVDDMFNIHSHGGIAGMRAKMKMFLITMVALVGGWWFYAKLGVNSIHIPLVATPLHLGWLIVPLQMPLILATG
jgi:phospho-N-acetylmuramoyl-pentapeptide-transferase